MQTEFGIGSLRRWKTERGSHRMSCWEDAMPSTFVIGHLYQNWMRWRPCWSLKRAFRQNQYSKASYFDGLPSDLGRRYPQLLARTFVHLAWKQQLLVQEPVTYKGGILVAAFKGRGAPSQCENYRALMVSSILAKSAHRSLRAESMKSFQTYRLPLQIGGLAGRSVAQGAHCLISYASMCRREGKSYGILFVDVKQAFYRLFREHIVSAELSDEAVQRLFSTLQLPAASFQDFAKELAERSAMEAAGSSPYVQAHVREALHGTWFKILGSERLSQTKRGSRPGDNMADILFAFAFKRILQKVLDQLQQEGCSMQVESLGIPHPYPDQLGAYPLVQFDALGPVWADDLRSVSFRRYGTCSCGEVTICRQRPISTSGTCRHAGELWSRKNRGYPGYSWTRSTRNPQGAVQTSSTDVWILWPNGAAEILPLGGDLQALGNGIFTAW